MSYVVTYAREQDVQACGPFKSLNKANRAAELLRQAGCAALVYPLVTWLQAAEDNGIERSPAAIMQAQYQKERVMFGGPWRLIDALGAHRRIQALVAIGWSLPRLSKYAGVSRWAFADILKKQKIHRTTFEAVRRVYEELWDKPATAVTPEQKIGIARAKHTAKRNRWAPPMAWDDIDNPEDHPKGIRKVAAWPTTLPLPGRDARQSQLGCADLPSRLRANRC